MLAQKLRCVKNLLSNWSAGLAGLDHGNKIQKESVTAGERLVLTGVL